VVRKCYRFALPVAISYVDNEHRNVKDLCVTHAFWIKKKTISKTNRKAFQDFIAQITTFAIENGWNTCKTPRKR